MSETVCIVAIGDEIVSGRTLNSNARSIAEALTTRGWAVCEHIAIPDTPRIIEEVLRERLVSGLRVIATGGLGPTLDDHTRKVVARLFQTPLCFSQKTYDDIRRRFGEHCPTIDDQSMQPERAVLLPNTVGTAPGLFLEDSTLFDGGKLFVLPGPPLEMKDVLHNQVLPSFFLPKKQDVRTFTIYGFSESDLEVLLEPIQQALPSLRIGIYPTYATVSVVFSADNKGDVLDEAEATLRSKIPAQAFFDPKCSLEEQVYRNLVARKWRLSVAESCTGGSIAAHLTSFPGISSVFAGGIVAYQNAVKESILEIPSKLIEAHDVVSEEVTRQMARSVRTMFHTDVALATSGYFGPTGGGKGGPVGTVCYTICTPTSEYSATRHFVGNREAICEKTVQAVLAKLCISTF